MNWPPMMMQLGFPSRQGRWSIWLPFFLVYPLLLLVSLIVLPFLLLAALGMLFIGQAHKPLLILPYAWNIVFKLRGLSIDVDGPGSGVLINIV